MSDNKTNTNMEVLNKKDQKAYMTQWQLVRLRFSKHKLASWALCILILLYLGAIFVEFVSPEVPGNQNLDHSYAPPQLPEFSFSKGVYVYPIVKHIDPRTKKKLYYEDRSAYIPLTIFAKGDEYKLWGVIPGSIHLFGVNRGKFKELAEKNNWCKEIKPTFYLLGSDKFGRDLLTRIIYGSRISLSIGLIGIGISFVLGLTIGGISGYFGGWFDMITQRGIEILNSTPKLPLWLALGAAMPSDWPPLLTYFSITVVLSLLGWTGLSRVVRGKLLALREEDYAVAARLLGASHGRIIFRHLLPGMTSHIIVALTLSVPKMILGETALSFLGLGLRPPMVSWGVLLQDCMDMQTVSNYPWILLPATFIIVSVMSYNFVGDGLRDAADPYA